MGDTRTDSGQFYPGGKVIPRQPVRPGGGSDADAVHYYAETKTAAEKAQARMNIDALGKNDSVAQSQVTGLGAALDGKRDKTDLTLKEPKNVHWVWISYDSSCPDGWLAKANAYGAPKPTIFDDGWLCGDIGGYHAFDHMGGGEDELSLTFDFHNDDDSVLFTAVATRDSATDTTPVEVDSIALVSQLPETNQLLTAEQRAEIAKVKDKADDFSEWVPGDGAPSDLVGQPVFFQYDGGRYLWHWTSEEFGTLTGSTSDEKPTSLIFNYALGQFTATRTRVLRTGEAATPKEVAAKLDTPKAVPVYSASSTYEVGEIVLHDGAAYKCVTAITTAEAWNASHWTAATDAELAARLKGFKSDGSVTDAFAANLFGKQVAISAMHYAIGTAITASTKLADRTTNFVNALSTLTDPIDLTFPDPVTGKCRDFLVRVHRATGGVAVSFTAPTGAVIYGDGFSTAIGENEDWLFAITETAANEWYVRAIKLEVAA